MNDGWKDPAWKHKHSESVFEREISYITAYAFAYVTCDVFFHCFLDTSFILDVTDHVINKYTNVYVYSWRVFTDLLWCFFTTLWIFCHFWKKVCMDWNTAIYIYIWVWIFTVLMLCWTHSFMYTNVLFIMIWNFYLEFS